MQSIIHARITRIRLFLFVLLFIFSADLRLAAQPDMVRLRFDWPIGTVGHLEQSLLRLVVTPGGADTTRKKSYLRFTVLEHREGRLIRVDSISPPTLHPDMEQRPSAVIRELFKYLQSLLPSFIVNGEGEFVRVEDISQIRRMVDSLYRPYINREGFSNEALAEFDSLLSTESLNRLVSRTWHSLMKGWPTADMEIGNIYSFEGLKASPFIAGFNIPISGRVMVARRLPCGNDETSNNCVELHMQTTTDSIALKESLHTYLDRMSGEHSEELRTAMRNTQLFEESTLVADPDTFLPYHFTNLVSFRMYSTGTTVEEAGGFLQEEFRTIRFTYE